MRMDVPIWVSLGVVLATAVAARANVIVTGDQDLLVLGSFEGVAIVSPRQFLERLDAGS